jgi:hypothetical protein
VREQEQSQLAASCATLAIGQAQIDRGEGIPYTLESLESIKQGAERKIREDREPKAMFCP